jgi:SAM-dependent methyltransferase
MWRIETLTDGAGAPYDRRAAAFDRLVRSRAYNRAAWSTSPAAYEQFAQDAFGSRTGPLVDVAAGSAAATAPLHARGDRPTVLVDLSRAMLERAARRIAEEAGTPGELPGHVRLLQADVRALEPSARYETVLGLGLLHLFDDVAGLVEDMRALLTPGGTCRLAGLVAETRRGARYLQALHRAGEVATPRTAADLARLLPDAKLRTDGCMAFVEVDGGPGRPPTLAPVRHAGMARL